MNAPSLRNFKNMNQKGLTNIILVVVIVILVGAVGYFTFVNKSEPVTQQPTPTPKDETANWKVYDNAKDEFSISIPKDWTYREGLPTPYVTIYFSSKDNGAKQVLMIDRFETNATANARIEKDLLSWAKENVAINYDGGKSCKDGTSSLVETDKNYKAVVTDCFKLDQEKYTIFTQDRMYMIVAPLSLKNKNPELYNKIYQTFEIK